MWLSVVGCGFKVGKKIVSLVPREMMMSVREGWRLARLSGLSPVKEVMRQSDDKIGST